MNNCIFQQALACLLITTSCHAALEENFHLINGASNEIALEIGPHNDERISPCSSFKIVLGVMGFDAGILLDESTPTWDYQEGYDDYLDAWKAPQTPRSWMKYSCIWFSKIIAQQLGTEKIQNYLASFSYGNLDMSGGLGSLTDMDAPLAWVHSSLKISPKEQAKFIQNLVQGALPISHHAQQMTKAIMFVEELPDDWTLYGKTGWSGSVEGQDGRTTQYAWFVGWVEKGDSFYSFAYNIRDEKIDLGQRIPRVKQLLSEANLLENIRM